ncbi:MAG: hypothetical protein RLZZ502_109, partial [Pseudomonadota bacterium]
AYHPESIERLVVINSPHPYLFAGALATDAPQQAASQYMHYLCAPQAEGLLSANQFSKLESFFAHGAALLPAWFERDFYHAAWSREDPQFPGHALTGGLNYYRVSPLKPPKTGDVRPLPTWDKARFKVKVPTRVIWGMADIALQPVLLQGLEEFVPDLHIQPIATAGHWLIHEHGEEIARLIQSAQSHSPIK